MPSRFTLRVCGSGSKVPDILRHRIARLIVAACSFALSVNPSHPGYGADTRNVPNIVFILADDLGWSDLACYGSKIHDTPHLDRFAQQAVRFTDAYAASPVCSPTRASLMTGKSPARLHMTIWAEAAEAPPRNRRLLPPVTVANLPHSETTIAKRLQAAGYLTALVGKWHLGDWQHYPETHGFDINIGGTNWGAPQSFFYPYRGSGEFGNEYRYVPHLEFGRPGEYLTDRLTDEALKIIDRAGNQPFFLYLAHHAVHTPIEAKAGDVELASERLAKEGSTRNAVYAAMVKNLDENVGRVLAHLEQRGLAKQTIVIFFSDNGGYNGIYHKKQVTDNAPLRSGKGSLYEGGVRVPLIVRWPGVTPGGVECHEPVLSTDLPWTLAAMAKLPEAAEPAVDGTSLVPLMKDPAAHLPREALYFHYPHYYSTTSPVSAVRAGDWKLVEYYEDQRRELFNLRDDLSETANLAAKMPDKAADLSRRLHDWLETVGAQMPVANPAPAKRH
jgi:arylsulfatase A-like enzyme